MKVAIVGGTGFVGSHIVESLEQDGRDVSMLVRAGSESKVPPGHHYRMTTGDVSSSGALQSCLSGCDAVIYCVGILRAFPGSGITFEETQYEGVVRTVEAAISCDVTRFLLMSANGVKVPGTRYQETKKLAEEVVLGSGIPATVFRPSVIFGNPRGRTEFATQLCRDMIQKPIPALAFYTGWRPGTGQIVMSPVHVDDVASAFSRALADDATIGKTYRLGGPESLSWTEMLERISSAVDRRKWIFPYPLGLMKLFAALFDWIPWFPVTRDQLSMLAQGNVADRHELEELIGHEARRFDRSGLSYLRE